MEGKWTDKLQIKKLSTDIQWKAIDQYIFNTIQFVNEAFRIYKDKKDKFNGFCKTEFNDQGEKMKFPVYKLICMTPKIAFDSLQ